MSDTQHKLSQIAEMPRPGDVFAERVRFKTHHQSRAVHDEEVADFDVLAFQNGVEVRGSSFAEIFEVLTIEERQVLSFDV